MPTMEKEQVKLYLPTPLLLAFKHRLVDDRKTMTRWLEESVRRYLAEEDATCLSSSATGHSPEK